jgi:hypothetical protein
VLHNLGAVWCFTVWGLWSVEMCEGFWVVALSEGLWGFALSGVCGGVTLPEVLWVLHSLKSSGECCSV